MIDNFKNMWSSFSGTKKTALVVICAVLLLLMAGAAWWVSSSRYDVLFSGLDKQDQASIVNQLEKLKVPFRISDDGSSILVASDAVHRTRLKIMSDGVDLKGPVGFEIFNESNYGASEFAQKINFQRALQGELSRSIASVEEIRSARVHLVLPEGGLLRRKTQSPPKASVVLTLQNGAHLSSAQVAGIQRLVAASVPELTPGAVVVSDQQGVTLSAPSLGDDLMQGGTSAKLDLKREADQYLTRKVAELLDRALGPGQAIVSVDATLDFEQIHSSAEQIIPVTKSENDSAGVVIRQRSTSSSQFNDLSNRAGSKGADSMETEYAYGKKMEQVVSTPGGIRRVSIGIFLLPHLDAERVGRIKEIAAMAVGFDAKRGDAIAIQTVDGAAYDAQATAAPADGSQTATPIFPVIKEPQAAHSSESIFSGRGIPNWAIYAVLMGLALCVLMMMVLLWPRRRLPASQREAVLNEVKEWLNGEQQRGSVL